MKRILCIANSPTLRVELDAAAGALGSDCQFLFSADLAAGVALLRHEAIDLVAIELPANAEEIQHWNRVVDSSVLSCPMIGILSDEAEQTDGVVVEAVRFGLRDFLHRPASGSELSQILSRLTKPQHTQSRRGQLIMTASTKGGVGKSTIATNLAVSIAQQYPDRVLLIDVSLQLGVTASLLDLKPTTTMASVAAAINRLDGTLLREMALHHESGLDVIPAPVSPAEAGDIDEAVVSVLLGIAKNTYDFVIVDTFPMIDAVMLSVFDRCDQIVIVTENVVPTLSGTAAMIQVLDQLQIPKERRMVVLNRYQRLAGSLSVADVADRLSTNIDAIVPNDRRIIEAANLGKPLVLRNRWRRSTAVINKLAKRILKRLKQTQSNPAANLSAAPSTTDRSGGGSAPRPAVENQN